MTGNLLFDEKNDKEILKNIELGIFDEIDFDLKHVSKDAKNLLKQFLTYGPAKRISAADALKSKWIENLGGI